MRTRTRRPAVRRVAQLVATALVAPTVVWAAPGSAGAVDATQLRVAANESCAERGLHVDTGVRSSCYDVTIQTEILVNGADVPEGTYLKPGQTVTVRLTIQNEGGQKSFYEEDQDGLKRNEVGGHSDIRAQVAIGLPPETGTLLGTPTNVLMSRSDGGDRGNGPGVACSSQALDEPAVSDGLTRIGLGNAPVGGTQMSASITSGTLNAVWDDMAWDRCRATPSVNAVYAGHLVEFEQSVLKFAPADSALTWNLGQFAVARDNLSQRVSWGTSTARSLRLGADVDGDGTGSDVDPDDANACVPDDTVGVCDRDGDGEVNQVDPDPSDPCEVTTGLSSLAICDEDGDGVPSPNVPGSDGIRSVRKGAMDPDDNDGCNPDPGSSACDTDGDGEPDSTDVAPTNPCIPLASSDACVALGAGFIPIKPTRLADSRTGLRTAQASLSAGSARTVQASGTLGVAGDATAVVVNVTATRVTGDSEVSIWANGTARPPQPQLNTPQGATRASMVIVPVGANGLVRFDNRSGTADVVIDVFGYFSTSGAGMVSLAPRRIFDTRTGTATLDVPFAASESRDLRVAGVKGVPTDATAVIVNATSVGSDRSSYLSVYPKGDRRPYVSTLNWSARETAPNLTIVPVGDDGSITLFNRAGHSDVLLDLVGYVSPTGANFLRTVVPRTVVDTTVGLGTAAMPFGAASTRDLTATSGVVPDSATTVLGSITSVSTTASSTYLNVYPTDQARPNASNLNTVTGDRRSNALITPMVDHRVRVYNFRGDTHITVTYSGWFGPRAVT